MGDSQVAHTRNCPVPLLHWAEAEYVLLLTEQLVGVADAGAAAVMATMPPATRLAALIATRTRLLAIDKLLDSARRVSHFASAK
jgi:hypothetical protein